VDVNREVRIAEKSDLAALYALDHVARRSVDRQNAIAQAVSEGRTWVATCNGTVAGYGIMVHHFFGHSFVELLYVDAVYRHQGVGSTLLSWMEEQSQTPLLFTSTNLSNHPMQRLLEKHGYISSGIIYNLDPGDPELIYCKALPHR
jgi:ribosomal protein S18 acetylase RimI-like enzyme